MSTASSIMPTEFICVVHDLVHMSHAAHGRAWSSF